MDKVFMSGSISIKSLRDHDLADIVNSQVIKGNREILIGDACGVDKAVQQILAEQGCRSVTVYFSGEKPRNNIGNWQTRQIHNPENLTGRSRYQLKDKAMADDCDCGLMFWDGKSKGTQYNMECLDRLNKDYFVVCCDKNSPVYKMACLTKENTGLPMNVWVEIGYDCPSDQKNN